MDVMDRHRQIRVGQQHRYGGRRFSTTSIMVVVVLLLVWPHVAMGGSAKSKPSAKDDENEDHTIVDTAGWPERGVHNKRSAGPPPVHGDEDEKYTITFLAGDIDEDEVARSRSSIVTMHSRDGKLHRCVVPHRSGDSGDDEDDGEQDDSVPPVFSSPAAERYSYNALVYQVLKDNCLYRLEGWWTYEYCFGKSVRQYHASGEVVEAEFILGKASVFELLDAESSEFYAEMEKGQPSTGEVVSTFTLADHRHPVPYYSLFYSDGTKCDLTRLPRKAEVRHYCTRPGKSFIDSVREPRSCEYIINVNIGALCNHRTFRTEEEVGDSTTIKCYRNKEGQQKDGTVVVNTMSGVDPSNTEDLRVVGAATTPTGGKKKNVPGSEREMKRPGTKIQDQDENGVASAAAARGRAGAEAGVGTSTGQKNDNSDNKKNPKVE